MTTRNARGKPGNVLLLDTDGASRRPLQLQLLGWGYDVRAFGCATCLLASDFGEADPLVVGESSPDAEAPLLIERLRRRGWRGQAILVAPPLAGRSREDARRQGFAAMVRSPVRRLPLVAALDSVAVAPPAVAAST